MSNVVHLRSDRPMTAERIANRLFLEMCSNSKAGHDLPELREWYENGLEWYEEHVLGAFHAEAVAA